MKLPSYDMIVENSMTAPSCPDHILASRGHNRQTKKADSIPMKRLISALVLLLFCLPPLVHGADNKTDPKKPHAAGPATNTPDAPVFSSVEQRRVLQALQDERRNIQKERKELANRKKELKRLEAEVDKKLAQLETIRQEIKKLLAQKDAREQKRIRDLSKMYAKMSPDKAAAIISTLDQKLAVSLLADMKTKAAAKILNNMDRDKAAQLTTAFSSLKGALKN